MPTSIRPSWGWNRIWLDPAFRAWNIEEYLPPVTCPVLAIQGEDDEDTGRRTKMRRIGAAVADVELPAHSGLPALRQARLDQPDAVIGAIARFVDRVATPTPGPIEPDRPMKQPPRHRSNR